jgi:hypothetical protein
VLCRLIWPFPMGSSRKGWEGLSLSARQRSALQKKLGPTAPRARANKSSTHPELVQLQRLAPRHPSASGGGGLSLASAWYHLSLSLSPSAWVVIKGPSRRPKKSQLPEGPRAFQNTHPSSAGWPHVPSGITLRLHAFLAKKNDGDLFRHRAGGIDRCYFLKKRAFSRKALNLYWHVRQLFLIDLSPLWGLSICYGLLLHLCAVWRHEVSI